MKKERRRVGESSEYVGGDGVVSVGGIRRRWCRFACFVYLAGDGVGRSAVEVGRFRSAQDPGPCSNTAGGQRRKWNVSSLTAPNAY